MMEIQRPLGLGDEHWAAIEDGQERCTRARSAGDLAGAVGAAKDLCETIARVILAARHADTSSLGFPGLISAAHRAIERHPQAISDSVIRDMASAARNLATPLAELRNAFGTGHGRPILAPTTVEHAGLAVDGALTWGRWALLRLDVVLSNTVDQLIADLEGGASFTRGSLPERLSAVGVETLGPEDLHRLGRAIAHRGAHRGTFVVEEDGIDAVVADPESYPLDLRRGLISGLFVDANGYVRARMEDLPKAIALTESLGDASFLEEFSIAVSGADFSYAMELQTTVQIAALLDGIVEAATDGRVKAAWARLRDKFGSGRQ